MSEAITVEVAEVVKGILVETLQRNDIHHWPMTAALLGAVAEFDSMAVVTVLTQVEDHLGIVIDDDEISAEIFETLGSLIRFVDARVN